MAGTRFMEETPGTSPSEMTAWFPLENLETVTCDSGQQGRVDLVSRADDNHTTTFMWNDSECVSAFVGAVLFLGVPLHGKEKCPVEVKLLLSPPTIQTVIESLRFEKETTGRVYFFDTDDLNLLKQGVIVRVRQGKDNDLTVKVRVPEDNKQLDTEQLREHFPCEINITGAGEDTDYSVRRKYKAQQLPETGPDISRLLSPPQKRMLQETRASIDWCRVKRIADIKLTKRESTSQSSFRKLTLESWEWALGNILELSAMAESDAGEPKYAELQQLVKMKNFPLSARQGSKTSVVLEALTQHTSPPE